MEVRQATAPGFHVRDDAGPPLQPLRESRTHADQLSSQSPTHRAAARTPPPTAQLSPTTEGYVFLTPTWRGDLPFFLRLRSSMEHVGCDVDHYVVVDTEDRDLFAELPGQRRVHLLTTADVLPPAAERHRVSRRAHFARWDPRRYAQPRPVPGWYAQMFVKLWFAHQYRSTPVRVCRQ